MHIPVIGDFVDRAGRISSAQYKKFTKDTRRAYIETPRNEGKGEKSLRHREFPGGPPSKYYPGPTMLNFRDQTRTGVFIVVWS